MDCEETYAGTPCLGCTTAALKISELQLQVDALKQQAHEETRESAKRIRALTEIKLLCEVILK